MFDVTPIQQLVDQAAEQFHALFDGKLSNGRVEQFDHFLAGLNMAIGHSSVEAEKEQVANG